METFLMYASYLKSAGLVGQSYPFPCELLCCSVPLQSIPIHVICSKDRHKISNSKVDVQHFHRPLSTTAQLIFFRETICLEPQSKRFCYIYLPVFNFYRYNHLNILPNNWYDNPTLRAIVGVCIFSCCPLLFFQIRIISLVWGHVWWFRLCFILSWWIRWGWLGCGGLMSDSLACGLLLNV